MYADILRRFSGRIVLSLLVAAILRLTTDIGDRELLFILIVAAVYLFWVPARYLLGIAVGVLILAAVVFSPLKEDASERLLRLAYYIVLLTVSRELMSAILAPFRLSQSIKQYVATLESQHYRAMSWLVEKSNAIFHQLQKTFVAMGYIVAPQRSRHIRIIFYILLTTAVALPWFVQPGYLFLLDYVWPPSLPVPQPQAGFITSLPHEWVFWFTSQVIPTHIVQKIVFSLPLLLAAMAASQLVGWLLRENNVSVESLVASLAAGIFYALNPFVVTRVFMGQIYFLLGYALTPWAVLAALQFLKRPTMRWGLSAGAAIAGVMLTNAHHIFLVPLIVIPLFIRPRLSRSVIRHVPYLIVPLLLPAALGAVVYSSSPVSPLDPRSPWARLLQAPYSGTLWVDILALTAHWKTNLLFAFPYESLASFTPLLVIIATLMSAGIWYLRRRPPLPGLVYQLAGIGIISFLLASGVSHPLTEPAAAWLYTNIPWWIGMRDSAKLIANLALVETILLGAGVAAVIRAASTKRFVASLILVVLLWFVAPAYYGFSGQVLPVEYPTSWSQWNDILAPEQSKAKMLVLPWNMYPALAWLDERPVINPAVHFFTHAEVITGDASTVGGIGESITISPPSAQPFSPQQLSRLVTENHVRYIALLADAEGSEMYQFLHTQQDWRLVFIGPELIVWEN